MSASTLFKSTIWLCGPDWLQDQKIEQQSSGLTKSTLPEECQSEMKRQDLTSSLATVSCIDNSVDLNDAICLKNYSSSSRLFRITALILKVAVRLRKGSSNLPLSELSQDDINQARLTWIKNMQTNLTKSKDFPVWRQKLDLFQDEEGLWRCGGRMSNSSLTLLAQNPILLDKDHYLTRLLILDAHKRVLHNGVRETLSELRSVYWVIRGRQIIKGILSSCVVCRRFEGAPCKGIQSPPLPSFRVKESKPFQTTGIDFAGPLYVRTLNCDRNQKVWMVLYTCYSTRAVHLDLVIDMTSETFLRSFRRFTARRGIPCRVVSDNAKTFKSAALSISGTLRNQTVQKYFGSHNVVWQFNLEKSPWQGGVFERMIKSAKRCLRKSIGKNCLSFDELLTLVTEVECVLNSRPLTYVYSDDVTEPLTPSHLLVGHRILSLPSGPVSIDTDDEYAPTSEVFTRKAVHLERTLRHFWKRWKLEYLQELREFHRTSQQQEGTRSLQQGDVVIVYDEDQPRGLWRLGKIENVIPSVDGKVRGVRVKVMSRGGRIQFLRRPIQHIYPLEVRSNDNDIDKQPLEVRSIERQ